MIDLHTHILPGLDDEAADWNQALAMCRLAQDDGIKTLVATPHYYPRTAPLEPALIEEQAAKLRRRCAEAQVELEILSGAEVALDASLPSLAKEGRLPTLGPGNRYFILEMPPASPGRGLGEMVFQLQLAGLPPHLLPSGTHLAGGQRLVLAGASGGVGLPGAGHRHEPYRRVRLPGPRRGQPTFGDGLLPPGGQRRPLRWLARAGAIGRPRPPTASNGGRGRQAFAGRIPPPGVGRPGAGGPALGRAQAAQVQAPGLRRAIPRPRRGDERGHFLYLLRFFPAGAFGNQGSAINPAWGMV